MTYDPNRLLVFSDLQPFEPRDKAKWRQWAKENWNSIQYQPQIKLKDVNEKTTLRRFLDLPKLLDLLLSRQLFLAPLRALIDEDPYECNAAPDFSKLNREELIKEAFRLADYAPEQAPSIWSHHVFGTASFSEEIESMDLDEIKEAVWFLHRERLKDQLVCNCWYAGEGDSDAMWKIYSDKLGVAVKTTASRLKSAILTCTAAKIQNKPSLTLAMVKYGDDEACGDTDPWLIKRRAFSHEVEARLFCEIPLGLGSGMWVDVNVSDLVEEIVITPFAKPFHVKTIKAAIAGLGFQDLTVRESAHMKAPSRKWPKAKRMQKPE